jgi:hypothetical protein
MCYNSRVLMFFGLLGGNMFYVIYLTLSLMFCSTLASDKPNDGLLAKASALLAIVAKKIPHKRSYTQARTQEKHRDHQLAQARTAVQQLDGHLQIPAITNIVVECLGSGSSLLKISDFLSPILPTLMPHDTVVEMGVTSFSQEDDYLHFVTTIRMKGSLLRMMASISSIEGRNSKVRIIPLHGRNFVRFEPDITEEQRQEYYRNLFEKTEDMHQKTFLDGKGHHMVIRPLDYIPKQGARDFEIIDTDDTSYLIFKSDPTRFTKT